MNAHPKLPPLAGAGAGCWTDERVDLLKKLWADGLSASQIAKQLRGVSRNAVIGKAHRIGLTGRAEASKPTKLAGPRPEFRRAPIVHPPRSVEPPKPPRAPMPPERNETALCGDLLDLKYHMCRWPIGDPQEPGFGFCGRRKSVEGSYCEGHAARAVNPAASIGPKGPAELARSLRRYVA